MKRLSNNFLLTVLLVAAVTNGCRRNGDKTSACGNFESTKVIVSALSQGELLSLNSEEGDTIAKGQRIGSVDSTSAIIQRRQVLAEMDANRSKIVNLDAQLRVQEQQRKNLLREANRLDKLQKENAVPLEQVDDVVGQLQVLDAQTTTIKTQRKVVSDEVRVLESQLDEIEYLLEKCRIINPVNGVVLEKHAESGEMVLPGKELYTIADMRTMELKAFVSGDKVSECAVGDSVWVLTGKGKHDNYRIPGVITWISSEVEFVPNTSKTCKNQADMMTAIRVKVVNDGKIRIGMPGEVVFARKKVK
jgi:HlyD family secretion protein